MTKLDAKQLRKTLPRAQHLIEVRKYPVTIILDNVLDTYNVGAIFRLAEAVAAEKVILCGGTETPPNSRIKKASINTTEWVAWEYHASAVEAIVKLKSQISSLQVIAVEQNAKSVPYDTVHYELPIALVVGHETNGVSQEVLEVVDQIVELPMWGVNTSLNVMVSLGIILYKVMETLPS